MPTVEPYRVGFCPQCQAQICVQDTNGKWATKKKNFAQMDMTFSDGHRVRTIICKSCLSHPDYEKIMAAIFHDESQACGAKTKEFLKFKTEPVEVDEEYDAPILKEESEDKDLSKNLGEKIKLTRKIIEFQKLERGLPFSHQVKNKGEVLAFLRQCGVCNKEFSISRKVKLKAVNYCSQPCYWESKKDRVEKECLECGEKISIIPCNVREENFCSIICRSKFRTGANHHNWKEANKNCEVCNSEIHHKLATRKAAKFCSKKCSNLGKTGELAPHWNGGPKVYPRSFFQIKDKIRERDNDSCVICKTKKYGKRNLHVHHIDENTMNNDESNLTTLCNKCHSHVHLGKILLTTTTGGKTGGIPSQLYQSHF